MLPTLGSYTFEFAKREIADEFAAWVKQQPLRAPDRPWEVDVRSMRGSNVAWEVRVSNW